MDEAEKGGQPERKRRGEDTATNRLTEDSNNKKGKRKRKNRIKEVPPKEI